MKYKFLKSAEVQEILQAYPNSKAEVLAKKHGVPVRKIYATAKRYGVKKSAEFLSSPDSGRMQKGQSLSPNTRFKNGDQSATKKKREQAAINKDEKIKKWKEGLWKKGNVPINIAKKEEVRWRPGFGYYYIKLQDNQWEVYHRWLWKKENGPIPEDCNIVFKDGNPKNCILENLECLTNEELMLRNSIHKYPSELVEVMLMNGKLKKEINKLEKNG